MKKKIFATITTLLLLVSVFASVPAALADEPEVTFGGLDFYSITIHYQNPILVRYYETKVKEKNEEGKNETKEVKYFYNVDAESDEEKYLTSKDLPMLEDTLVIPAGTRTNTNFYQLNSNDGTIKTGLNYSKIPYTNAFITSIIDASAINTTAKFDLWGITDPYDSNTYVNQNPNLEYASFGDNGMSYAIASETDENGNHYYIDRNGYIVNPSDFIWRTSDGDRIELFVPVPEIRKTGTYTGKKPNVQVVDTGELQWVPYSERFDDNGMIKNVQSIGYRYIVSDEEYDAFLADESQQSLKMHIAESVDAYKDTKSKQKTIMYAQTIRTDKTINPDTYFSTDREFTAADILKDEGGNIAYGTPKIGTPVIKAAISGITAEIDAAGKQLYDNVADDPQQKNTITLTIGATEQDAALYKKWFDEGLCSEETYNSLYAFTVGTAKSVTTRTEILTSKSDYKDQKEYGYSPTVKSVEFETTEDILKRIPASASLYISFHIEELQPADIFPDTYQKKFYALDNTGESTLLQMRVNLRSDTEADRKDVLKNGLITKSVQSTESTTIPTWVIILIIAGGVVVVAAIVIIIIVSSKKNKNKAPEK